MFSARELTLCLGLLAVASMLLYFPLNRGRARLYLQSPLDAYIPFVAGFIFPYFALLPFIALALVAVFTTPYAEPLYLALVAGVLAGSLTRYFVPGGIHQPEIRRHDLAHRLVHWLYLHDDRAHTFPSSHVLISTIASYYLALAFPAFSGVLYLSGLLIALSTVFVKQHYLVDVIAGFGYGVLAILFANAYALR